MTGKKSDKPSKDELPKEIIVSTAWAEAETAIGRLKLTRQQIEQLDGNATISLPNDLVRGILGPQDRTAEVDWIEPMDAVHWLSPKMGGDAAAKSAIAERLRDGAILCTRVWTSQGPDIGPISKQRPQFPSVTSRTKTAHWVSPINSTGKLVIIGAGFWKRSDDWEADVKRWDWSSGLFVTSWNETITWHKDGLPIAESKSKSRSRMVASGVRFNSKHIKRIVELESSDIVKATGGVAKRGTTGPRRKKFNYGPVLARLQSEILSGEISRFGEVSGFGVQAKLEREITYALTEDDGLEPNESTVRRRAVELMRLWELHDLHSPR